MRISKNFTLEELVRSATATRRGINNNPSEDVKNKLIRLVNEILQPLRDKYGKPIIISSGYRSPLLNAAVGGVKTSQHLKGEAADIKCENVRELFLLAKRMIADGDIKVGQLIDEKHYSWIHISLPNNRHNNQILHL